MPASTVSWWRRRSKLPTLNSVYGLPNSVNGQLVEEAIETLSPDGKTFTDMLWRAGHDDEKDVRVYVKR
jgi:hypothetical protein